MKEFLQKLKTLNESRKVIRWANVLLFYLCLELIRVLLVFKLNEYNDSPLIPENVDCMIYAEYVNAGLIISSGFILALGLKLYRQHFLVATIGTLTVIAFYIYTWTS